MRLTIENIDVKEGDKGQPKLSAVFRDIPLLDSQNTLNRTERHNLLEKIKGRITEFGVREVSNWSRSRPGDDGYEQNAKDDGTLDPIHHEHDGQKTATKDADPHSRVAHFV